MKQKYLIFCMLLLTVAMVHAGYRSHKARTGGIVFLGGYWDTQNDWAPIQKVTNGLDETVYVGGYVGWIDFYSRLDDHFFLYCGMGAGADVMVTDEFETDEVRVKAITPLIFGARYDLVSADRITAVQPYVSAGAGPYWEHHIHVIDNTFSDSDQVSVQSNVRFGLYWGGGAFYRITDTFVLNFDMKYHLLDLDVHNEFSGYEIGIGFGFFWGEY